MTKLNDVVQRAISDAAFRSQLRSDPAKALRGFSLSPEETRALTSRDPDCVAPTSGQVDSGATIDPGSVDSASLQTGENQVDTGAQVDSTDAAHNTITPGGDHVTDY